MLTKEMGMKKILLMMVHTFNYPWISAHYIYQYDTNLSLITHRKGLHFGHVQCWNLSLCKSIHLKHSLDTCSISNYYFLLLLVVVLYITIMKYSDVEITYVTFLSLLETQVLV